MTENGFSLRDGLYAISAVSHFTFGARTGAAGAYCRPDRPPCSTGRKPAAAIAEALQIMDSDDGEQAFLHGTESLIGGLRCIYGTVANSRW